MALIDELKEKRTACYRYIDGRKAQIAEQEAGLRALREEVADLDRVIAALQPPEPQPIPFDVELEAGERAELAEADAAEQLRGEWLSASRELAATEKRAAELTVRLQDIERGIAALEDGAGPEPGDVLFDGTVTGEDFDTITVTADPELTQDVIDDAFDPEQEDDVFADAYAAEIISELTGHPAIEPESGLHGEAVSEDGYAPVTNPDADAIAQGHDWYSPERVAEREKASRPWSAMGTLWGKPKVDA